MNGIQLPFSGASLAADRLQSGAFDATSEAGSFAFAAARQDKATPCACLRRDVE
jgi:hypothetical protein